MQTTHCLIVGFLFTLMGCDAVAELPENPTALAARDGRRANEWQILSEYFAFLRIRNESRDKANLLSNAEPLFQIMDRRGLQPRLLQGTNAAPVIGQIGVAGGQFLGI